MPALKNLGAVTLFLMPLLNLFIFYLAEDEWTNSFVLSLAFCMLSRAIAFPIWNEVEKLAHSYQRFNPFHCIIFFLFLCLLSNLLFGGFALMIAPIIIVCFSLKLLRYLRLSELLMQSIPVLSFFIVPNFDVSAIEYSKAPIVILFILTLLSLYSVSGYINEHRGFSIRSVNTALSGLIDEVFVVTYAAESFFVYKMIKTAFGFFSRLQYSMNIEVYSEAVSSNSFLTKISSSPQRLTSWNLIWVYITIIFFALHLIFLSSLEMRHQETYIMLTGAALLSSSKFVGGWSGSYFYLNASKHKILKYNTLLLFALIITYVGALVASDIFFITSAAVNFSFNIYVFNWYKRKTYAAQASKDTKDN